MTRVRGALGPCATATALALLTLACGSEQRPESEGDNAGAVGEAPEGASAAPAAASAEAAAEAPAPPAGPTCAERYAEAEGRITAVVDGHGACTFENDCVWRNVDSNCLGSCGVALNPRGVVALQEASAAVAAELCPAVREGGCAPPTPECVPMTPRCDGDRCVLGPGDAPLRELPVPAENAAELSDTPPPRPAPGEAEEERGRRLFDAVVHDDPARIADFFFPREAFAVVKAIADPDGYWQRLMRRFARDIHELHEELTEEHGDLSTADFGRLDIIRRGGWVPLREEGNALPYWVSRHSQLYYTVNGVERQFEVRVLITWGERWYVTHLKEFH